MWAWFKRLKKHSEILNNLSILHLYSLIYLKSSNPQSIPIMKTNIQSPHYFCKNRNFIKSGFTLLEMTVVIVVILTLISVSAVGIRAYRDWQLGAEAGTKLRSVYTAQRTYLAEHPTEAVSTLTDAKVIPYLSNGSAALPTVEDLDGSTLTIKVDKAPPYLEGDYDPSGSTSDGQWDVGE